MPSPYLTSQAKFSVWKSLRTQCIKLSCSNCCLLQAILPCHLCDRTSKLFFLLPSAPSICRDPICCPCITWEGGDHPTGVIEAAKPGSCRPGEPLGLPGSSAFPSQAPPHWVGLSNLPTSHGMGGSCPSFLVYWNVPKCDGMKLYGIARCGPLLFPLSPQVYVVVSPGWYKRFCTCSQSYREPWCVCMRCGGGESCHRILSSEVFGFTVLPILPILFFLVIIVAMSMQSYSPTSSWDPAVGIQCCSFTTVVA